jgi:hypothetical protein
VGVAGHGHLAAQAVHVELAALLEEEGVGRQEGRRRQPVEAVEAGTRAMSASPRLIA